eukprot:gene1738-2398_t
MPPPPTPSPLATDIESVVSEDCAMALISALEQHLPDQSFPDTIASSGFTVTPRASYPDARPAFRVYFNFMDVSSDDGVSVDYDSDGEIANADSYPDGMTKSVSGGIVGGDLCIPLLDLRYTDFDTLATFSHRALYNSVQNAPHEFDLGKLNVTQRFLQSSKFTKVKLAKMQPNFTNLQNEDMSYGVSSIAFLMTESDEYNKTQKLGSAGCQP